jgi:hypothetical protein
MSDKVQEIRKELVEDMPDSWYYKPHVVYLLTELENKNIEINLHKAAHKNIRSELDAAKQEKQFWMEAAETQKNNNLSILRELDVSKQENERLKKSLYIPCDKCGGSGFNGYGTGYDATCDCTGGYIGLLDAEEALNWRHQLKQAIEALETVNAQLEMCHYSTATEEAEKALRLIRQETGETRDT